MVCGKNAGSGGSLYECIHQVVTQNNIDCFRYTVEPQYNEPLYKELSPRYNVRFSLPKQ